MDHLRDQLQQALGSTYRIDRELGGGGMSRVFLATETSLDRKVVLKVLPSDLAGGVSVDRFKREISTAAKLQHAHIVPLLSAGDASGLPWFSMPFVEGDSLRARLRKGELPLGEVVRTLRDVASALAYAHGRGVVHRDIKPENILVADGVASVTDFGVAKAIAEAGARGNTLTSVGVALGTPAYMAPEQVAADERTDHRADIYALGLVGYEMLAGHNPFMGRSQQATMSAQMNEMPAAIESVRASTPPALARLVMRCIAKSAADRPQSASELVQELDAIATPSGGTAPYAAASGVAYPAPVRSRTLMRAAVAVGAVVLAAGAFAAWRSRGPMLDPRTIAVLPFDAPTSDTVVVEAARVAADWLRQGIAQTDEVRVVASTLVDFALGDAKARGAEPIDRVAAVTRAGTVVTGSVSRFGDSLRIQASVVDARTRRVIRAIEPVAGPVKDPIVAINALREKVLGSIVSGDVVRGFVIAGQPPSYGAYREYIQGTQVYTKSQPDARPYFRRAIAIDRTFAAPYLYLTSSFTNAAQYDSAAVVVSSLDSLKSRLSTVDRLWLDFMHANLDGDFEKEFGTASTLVSRTDDPTATWEHGRSALLTLRVGLAIEVLEGLDSMSAVRGWQPHTTRQTDAYHLAGEHAKELTYLDLARKRYPNNQGFVNRRLRAFGALRDLAAASALADTILRSMPNPSGTGGLNAITFGAWEFDAHGDSAAARQLTRLGLKWTLEHMPPKPAIGWHRSVGRAYLDLGVLDSAAAHLALALPDTGANGMAVVAQLAIVAAHSGDSARARHVADSLGTTKRKWDRGLTPASRATVLAVLGEREQAVQLLRTSLQLGLEPISFHYIGPFKPLRGYPPFEALIALRK